MRVLADNPEVRGTDAPAPLEIAEPADWRLFTFEQPKADGSVLRVELLRPLGSFAGDSQPSEGDEPETPPDPESIAMTNLALSCPLTSTPTKLYLAAGWVEGILDAAVAPTVEEQLIGAEVTLDLPEFGAVGVAKIVAVQACPDPEPGTGRLVTGRFQHEAANVIDLWIEGEREPIGTTSNHPFWSEDRHAFVEAGDLKPGELLRTIDGAQTRVLHPAPRGPPETVYNFEVEGVHAYSVGTSGVVVHNGCENVYGTVTHGMLDTGTGTTREYRKMARGLGNSTDDAGHIIGKQLGGRRGKRAGNIHPMDPHMNRGALSKFESGVASKIRGLGSSGSARNKVTKVFGPGSATRAKELVYHVLFSDGSYTSGVFSN